MEPSTARPFKASRVALVIEVLLPVSNEDSWVQVVSSIPGRDGTKTKTWMLPSGQADVSTTDDLMAYVSLEVITALALIAGVQLVLPEV